MKSSNYLHEKVSKNSILVIICDQMMFNVLFFVSEKEDNQWLIIFVDTLKSDNRLS